MLSCDGGSGGLFFVSMDVELLGPTYFDADVQKFVTSHTKGFDMVEKGCLKRLQKEYHTLCKEPPLQIVAGRCPTTCWSVVGFVSPVLLLEDALDVRLLSWPTVGLGS